MVPQVRNVCRSTAGERRAREAVVIIRAGMPATHRSAQALRAVLRDPRCRVPRSAGMEALVVERVRDRWSMPCFVVAGGRASCYSHVIHGPCRAGPTSPARGCAVLLSLIGP